MAKLRVVLLLLLACGRTSPGEGASRPALHRAQWEPIGDDLVVPLRWVRGWETAEQADSWDVSRGGMWWQLANLGAVPPISESGIEIVSQGDDEVVFTLDLDQAGFPAEARGALRRAVRFVRDTDEVRLHGGLDLGAFFLRTLYEPWSYYTVTGACPSDPDWTAARLGPDAEQYAVIDSLLTDGHRLDTYEAYPDAAAGIAHLVAEGTGDLREEGDFRASESESIDVMPNGMLRYAVYDFGGDLRPWGVASPAGQPGKCMWCHEDHLQEGDPANPSAEGYVATADFLQQIRDQQALVQALRTSLETAVVFDPPEAHDHGEHLTQTWLLPPLGRLAREWHLAEDEVRALVASAGFVPFQDPEYAEFGDRITRAEADTIFAALLPVLAAEPDHPFAGWEGPFTPIENTGTAREPVDEPLVWGEPDELPCR